SAPAGFWNSGRSQWTMPRFSSAARSALSATRRSRSCSSTAVSGIAGDTTSGGVRTRHHPGGRCGIGPGRAFYRRGTTASPEAGAGRVSVAVFPGRSVVDARSGQQRQLFVGRLLLVEVLLQQGRGIIAAQAAGPGGECAVGGHLVVFDALRRGDEGRVHGGRVERLL